MNTPRKLVVAVTILAVWAVVFVGGLLLLQWSVGEILGHRVPFWPVAFVYLAAVRPRPNTSRTR